MNFKKTPFAIPNENQRDHDSVNDHPTLADLMREQDVLTRNENTVHHRRDLDSLG